jgi:hypothetical protein
MTKDTQDSLALIERVCAMYEAHNNDDPMLAAEIVRVIRAIAVQSKVVLLAGGPAAALLMEQLKRDILLWTIVRIEDDSIPDSKS